MLLLAIQLCSAGHLGQCQVQVSDVVQNSLVELGENALPMTDDTKIS
jgi:hypothetical protein